MKVTRSEYRALVRQDFHAFIEQTFYHLNPATQFLDGWHIEVIAAALEDCRRGWTKRLIINLPPRSLKSHCATVAFPAWLLGHNPSAQIICCSYAQELASKHAMDCRSLLSSGWYQGLFPTRLSSERQAVSEFMTTKKGFRMATSVGGMLTGRGADCIIVDDPLKPTDALSDAERNAVNNWFENTLYSRLNNKQDGCIVVVMQRLHEDDLVGHVLGMEPWKVIRFPAIAEEDEIHEIDTPYGPQRFERRVGEALHSERESLDVLNGIREAVGEYNFSGQYQQAPSPQGGGLVKAEWFKTYAEGDLPATFDMVLQSWDTANKATELSDYSVCITLGILGKHIYLLNVFRGRLGYPELRRSVLEQSRRSSPQTILIEDKASGTQLIQELIGEGMYAVQRYEPKMEKTLRMHSITGMIESGFVHLPDKAPWLGEFVHELVTFPNGRYDDQADAISQAFDWLKNHAGTSEHVLITCLKEEARSLGLHEKTVTIPESMPCPKCNGVMNQKIPNGLRCQQCGEQWPPPGSVRVQQPTRADVLAAWDRRRWKFGR